MRDDIWDAVHVYLSGTCYTPEQVVEHFELDCSPLDVIDKMLDMNLEICPCCGWWVESWELVDENDEQICCEDCRK